MLAENAILNAFKNFKVKENRPKHGEKILNYTSIDVIVMEKCLLNLKKCPVSPFIQYLLVELGPFKDETFHELGQRQEQELQTTATTTKT